MLKTVLIAFFFLVFWRTISSDAIDNKELKMLYSKWKIMYMIRCGLCVFMGSEAELGLEALATSVGEFCS